MFDLDSIIGLRKRFEQTKKTRLQLEHRKMVNYFNFNFFLCKNLFLKNNITKSSYFIYEHFV